MKGRQGFFLVVILMLMVALMLPACAPASTSPPTPTPTTPSPTKPAPVAAKTLKFGYSMPKGESVGAGIEWFATEFPKRTDGRYKVETYPSNSLFPMTAALDSVKKGVTEITFTSAGSFPKDFPVSLVASIPALGFQMEDVKGCGNANNAIWELYNTMPEIKDEFKDYVLLWPPTGSPYNFVSKKKEVHGPTDFAGMKVGGSGPKMEWVTKNGGAHVQMVPPQAYENMDKGVVDSAFLTLAQVSDFKIWEICDYFYTMDFGNAVQFILMNKESYAALGAVDQKIIMDLWKEASVESAKGTLANITKGKEGIAKAGKKITAPTPAERASWENAIEVVIQKWVNDTKVLGVNEATILKVLDAWKKIRPKYL